MTGIEPARLAALDPKSSMSTSSTTSAEQIQSYMLALGRQIYIIVISNKQSLLRNNAFNYLQLFYRKRLKQLQEF